MKKIIVLVLGLFILTGCSIEIKTIRYEYKDLDGNTGIADDCMTIRGNLVCDLEDGTRLSVKSFRRVYSD